MGRFRGRPDGYAPALEYYLRERPEGGKLRRPGLLRPPNGDARRECLVLVHGFNNHEGEAARAYLGFRNRQYALFTDTLLPGALEKQFGDAFWPGDADWPGPLDWLDFMVYPFAVHTAKNAAPELAQLLWRLPNLERVDFIAHSLGCRVTLETVTLLHQRGYPAIGRLCLMAAAVPCEMVESGGRFESLLRDLQAARVEIKILHSPSDPVLRFAFPPGQTFAGEPTMRALGLNGPPVDMPGRGANVSEQRIAFAGHSDYWGHRDNEQSEWATRAAGKFLKLGRPMREIPARGPGETRSVGRAREIGAGD